MPSSNSGTAPDGTTLVTNSQPMFDGLSEITGFGNATRITIVDETPGDATFGQVIGGFDPSKVAGTNVAANWTDAFGNFSVPVNAGAFTSNGLKTVKIFATDDAGSISNPVTLQFTLARNRYFGTDSTRDPDSGTGTLRRHRCSRISQISPRPISSASRPQAATVELLQANGSSFSPQVLTTSDPVTGAFTLTFPNPTSQAGDLHC